MTWYWTEKSSTDPKFKCYMSSNQRSFLGPKFKCDLVLDPKIIYRPKIQMLLYRPQIRILLDIKRSSLDPEFKFT